MLLLHTLQSGLRCKPQQVQDRSKPQGPSLQQTTSVEKRYCFTRSILEKQWQQLNVFTHRFFFFFFFFFFLIASSSGEAPQSPHHQIGQHHCQHRIIPNKVRAQDCDEVDELDEVDEQLDNARLVIMNCIVGSPGSNTQAVPCQFPAVGSSLGLYTHTHTHLNCCT